jgi:hypothetical protein
MNNASDASGIARELRPLSVFEEIVFCCFNKAPLWGATIGDKGQALK